MSAESTERLVERAQSGERAAFDELVRLHRPRLEPLVRLRIGARHRERIEVEDVIQETLARAFRSIGRFRFQGEDSYLAWLGGIAEHVIVDQVRKLRRGREVPLEGDLPASAASLSQGLRRGERFERLQRALGSLSPDHRQVVILARVEGIPIQEIARRMDRSPDAVTHLLLRALRKLRTTFGDTDSLHLPDRRLEDRGEPHGSE